MKYAEQYVVSGIGMARWICVIIVNKTSFYLLTFFPQYRIILSKPAMQMPEQNDSLRLKCNEIEMVSRDGSAKMLGEISGAAGNNFCLIRYVS